MQLENEFRLVQVQRVQSCKLLATYSARLQRHIQSIIQKQLLLSHHSSKPTLPQAISNSKAVLQHYMPQFRSSLIKFRKEDEQKSIVLPDLKLCMHIKNVKSQKESKSYIRQNPSLHYQTFKRTKVKLAVFPRHLKQQQSHQTQSIPKITPQSKLPLSKSYSKTQLLQLKSERPNKLAKMGDKLKRTVNFKNNLNQKLSIAIYFDFITALTRTHFIIYQFKGLPTAFVSKKNNGELVKSILRTRYWISMRSQYSTQINFVWSSKAYSVKKEYQPVRVKPQQANQVQQFSYSNRNLYKIAGIKEPKKYGEREPPFTINSSTHLKRQVSTLRIQNLLPNSEAISTKKGLFYSLKKLYAKKNKNLFEAVPFTLHYDSCFPADEQNIILQQIGADSIWIVKPGQHTNRGKGIFISKDPQQIRKIITNDSSHTYILQKYIQRPLLYQGRKFDIRCYLLITMVAGGIKGYFYEDGYVRTSAYQYNIADFRQQIHLTNDAMQSQFQNYGKYQSANKLSLNDLSKLLEARGISFQTIWTTIRNLSYQIIESSFRDLGHQNTQLAFQLFGLDLMIQQNGSVKLIEVNTNPCLQISGNILSVLIPKLIQNTLKIGLDPFFPPPKKRHFQKNQSWMRDSYLQNKFNLIFDSHRYRF